jgi:hypothetical protein
MKASRQAPARADDGLAGLRAIVGLMRTDLLPALTMDEAAARMGVGRSTSSSSSAPASCGRSWSAALAASRRSSYSSTTCALPRDRAQDL